MTRANVYMYMCAHGLGPSFAKGTQLQLPVDFNERPLCPHRYHEARVVHLRMQGCWKSNRFGNGGRREFPMTVAFINVAYFQSNHRPLSGIVTCDIGSLACSKESEHSKALFRGLLPVGSPQNKCACRDGLSIALNCQLTYLTHMQ